MNRSSTFPFNAGFVRIATLSCLLLLLGVSESWGAVKNATVTTSTTYGALTWSPAGAPVAGDDVTITYSGTGAVTLSGFSLSTPASGNFASFTIAGTSTGTLTLSATSASTIFTNRLTISQSTTLSNISFNQTAMTSNASSIASGETLTISNSTVGIGIGGILTVNGTVASTSATGLLSSASSQIVIPNLGAITYTLNSGQACQPPAMTIQAGGTLTVTGTNGTLSQFPSGGMSIAGTLVIGGAITVGTASANTPTYTGTASTLRYAKSASYSISSTAGREWPATNGPANVIIDNTGSAITITSSLAARTISGVLTLTQGVLSLTGTGNGLTFTAPASTQPIVRTNGTITCATTTALSFSPASGSGTWTLPASVFTSAPTVATLTVNMLLGNTLALNNQNIIVTGTYTQTSGVVVLGSGDLQFGTSSAPTVSISSPGTSKMIVTSATSGYLKRYFTTGAQSFTFPIGEQTGTAEYCELIFSFSTNTSTRVVGFKVADACNANIGSTSHHLSRYYSSFLSSVSGTYDYTVDLPFDGTTSAATTCPTATPGDAVGGTISTVRNEIGIAAYNGTTWVGYPGTVSTSSLDLAGDELTAPLALAANGSIDITGRKVNNDEACSATSLTPGAAGVITCGISSNGTVAGATETFNSSCAGVISSQPDVWYSFVATATSHTVRVTATGATFNPIVQTHPATGGLCANISLGNGTNNPCSNSTGAGGIEELQLNSLTIGTTYFVRVYHASSTPPADGRFSICVLTAPANDEICGAISLNPDIACSNTAGTAGLASETFNSTGCVTTGTQADVWYSFVAEDPIQIVEVTGTGTYNPVVQLHPSSGTCGSVTLGNGTNNPCVNNTGAGAIESLLLTGLTVGNTYFVRVYHASATVPSNTGFTICVKNPCTTYSGIVKIGPNGGDDFTSITAALNYFISCPYSGHIALELQTGYVSTVETFPLTFLPAHGSGVSKTMTIRPATGLTNLSITSSNGTATVDVDGADYIIFDGRPGGTGTPKQLTIQNTSTTGIAVRYIDDAENNTLQYCNIKGVNTSTTSGVIVFSTATANGNINNLIDNCDIGDAATVATNMIYSAGTASNENSVTVSNNNIFNFYGNGLVCTGINLQANNLSWSIANNSFYQTVTRTPTLSGTQFNCVLVNSSSLTSLTITGNYFGGNAPLAAGMWTVTGTSTNRFAGINITATSSGSANVIQNNKVSRISLSTGTALTTPPGAFCGIALVTGNANISGNTVGAATGQDSIVVTISSSPGTSFGISSTSTSADVISNNIIGGITVLGSSTSISHGFTAINTSSGTSTLNITGNLIGSATTAQSIRANTATTLSAQTVSGIISTGTAGGIINIQNNQIRNLYANASSSSSTTTQVRGINVGGNPLYDISNNTIFNLESEATNTGVGASAVIVGILHGGGGTAQTIANNTIYGLQNNNASNTNNMCGIVWSASSAFTNEIEKNFIHSFSTTNSSAASEQVGIYVAAGYATISNNMIRLGRKPDGSSVTSNNIVAGIVDNTTTSGSAYYFNSVLISGAASGGSAVAHSYAFRRSGASGTKILQNNIFANDRTGGFTGSLHYAFATNSTSGYTAANFDYNLFHSTDGSFFSVNNGTSALTGVSKLQALRTSILNSNLHSAEADMSEINFRTPNGDAATVDLRLNPTTAASNAGLDGTGVTTDRDGSPATRTTTPDLGADEDAFTAVDVFTPVLGTLTIPNQTPCSGLMNYNADITISDAGSTITGATFFYKLNAAAWSAATAVTGSLISGTTSNGTWRFVLNFPISTGEQYNYFVVTQDGNSNIWYSHFDATTSATLTTVTTQNAAASFTVVSATPLSGTVYVGTGAQPTTYTSITNAGGLFADINSKGLNGNLTVIIQGDVTNEAGTNALNAIVQYCGTGHTITITPDGSTLRTISGLYNGAGLIRFNGVGSATNGTPVVIIDGNDGSGGRALRFANTSNNTSTPNPTFAFTNNTNNVTVKNSIIEGADRSSTGSIVYIGAVSTGTSGNSYLTIDNNLIGHSANFIVNIIHAEGSGTVKNRNNTISNNEIFNFARYTSGGWTGRGILISSGGGNGDNWTISGNSIYAATQSNSPVYFIDFASGAASMNNVISGNFIGGTAAQCGGTYYQQTYNTSVLVGVVVNTGSVTISGNTFRNFRNTNTGSAGNVEALSILGSTQANVTGNTFGDADANLGIYAHGGADWAQPGKITGIYNNSTGAVTIDNNTFTNLIGAYSCGAGGFCAGTNLYVINQRGSGTVTITNNTISACQIQGGMTEAVGILLNPFNTSSGHLIEGNTIEVPRINGTGNGALAVSNGGIIVVPSFPANISGSIRRNTIYDNRNSNMVNNGGFYTSWSYIYGIAFFTNSTTNTWTVANNQISLSNPNGNSANGMVGIYDENTSPSVMNYFYNSVYVKGTHTAGTSLTLNTAAFERNYNSTAATTTLKNNIFINARSGAGKHYAIVNELNDANWIAGNSDNNLLVSANTATVGRWVGTDRTFAQWQSAQPGGSGGDASSVTATYSATTSSYPTQLNPELLFLDPAVADLHIGTDVQSKLFADNKGTPVSITTDIDGDPRHGTTPDAGVDEFNSCTPPTVASTTPGSRCGAGTVQLGATASAGTINWYAALTGGSSLGTGTTFTTPSISNTTTYYAEADDNGCLSTPRTAVDATVTTPTIVTWTAGATNVGDKTDWFNADNWTCNTVPTSTIDAEIPAAPTGGNFFPAVTSGTLNATTKDLTIQPGASLTIVYTITGGVPDGELAVHGTFTNASSTPVIGSGFLTMKSGSSIAGTVTVDYLKIDGNTSLAAGAAVNVRNELALFSGNLNTTNGTLTLKSTPTKTAYVNDFDFSTAGPYGTLTGNLTLERHIPATSGGNIFHYIGAVSSGTAGSKWTDDFNMAVTGTNGFITPSSCDPANPRTANTSNYGGLFTYHESNVTDCYLKGWKVENSSYTVAPGRGVAARINNNVVIEETGAYSAANTTVTNLSKTATNTTATSKGYNLVSNPFYAPISWSQVAADNLATWDGAAYVYNSSSGTYAVSNFLTSHLVINTNQAFFIRAGNSAANASNHTFVFNANTRTKGTNGIFYRQQQGYDYGLDITVQAANGKTDKTLVAFDSQFNDVFDNGYDAMKLFNDVGIPSVYTKTGDEQQAIQALPLISASSVTRSVPLSVLVTTSGAHTFTFDGVADFPQTSIIWLEDLKTGTIQYLRQNNTYSFTANVGDDKDRFVIHFAPELLITTTMADCSGNNGEIVFEQRGGIEWAFRLKDANDAVIASDVFSASRLLNQLAPGTYTLSLTHPISGYATTMTIEVNGLQPVTAAISAPVTEVFAGEAFTVDALTTGSTTYTWQMGDHTSYIDLSSVTYAYRLPGMYQITLTASNSGCTAQSTIRIIVNKRPDDVDTVSTGIPGVEAGNITIYESEDVLYISQSVTRQLADANVILYNNLGQVVFAKKLNGMAFGAKHTVSVNTAAGVYYVSVELADGHNAMRKVIFGTER